MCEKTEYMEDYVPRSRTGSLGTETGQFAPRRSFKTAVPTKMPKGGFFFKEIQLRRSADADDLTARAPTTHPRERQRELVRKRAVGGP